MIAFGWRLLIVSVALTSSVTRAADEPFVIRDPLDDDRVRPLVLANERTRDALPSFECDLAVTENRAVQPGYADHFDLVFRAKGSWRYVAGMPGTGPMERPMRVVRSEAYTAIWSDDMGTAQQDDTAKLTDWRGVAMVGVHAGRLLRFDPLLAAFGDGNMPLRQAILRHRPTGYDVAEATDDAGRRIVRVRVFTAQMPGPALAEFEYEFDPARGYVVTRSAWNYGARIPAVERLIDYQPAGGAWLPLRVRQVVHSYNSDPRTEVDVAVRLRSVGDLPDSDFGVDGLKLPAGAQLVRRSPGGSLQLLIRHDGVWLPMNLATRLSVMTTAPAGVSAPAGGSWGVWVGGLGLVALAAVWRWTARRDVRCAPRS